MSDSKVSGRRHRASGKAEPSLMELVRHLRGGRADKRARAARSLQHFRCEQSAEALRDALADRARSVRLASAHSLAVLYALPIELVEFADLLRRLASSDPVRRESGIRGLRSLVKEPLPS